VARLVEKPAVRVAMEGREKWFRVGKWFDVRLRFWVAMQLTLAFLNAAYRHWAGASFAIVGLGLLVLFEQIRKRRLAKFKAELDKELKTISKIFKDDRIAEKYVRAPLN
jgi:hypothetical protein